MTRRQWLVFIGVTACGISACGDGGDRSRQRSIDDSSLAARQDLLEALANGAEPTWILLKEASIPDAEREGIEAELRALERQGLVRSRRELASDPSQPADSEDEWWQLTSLGRKHLE